MKPTCNSEQLRFERNDDGSVTVYLDFGRLQRLQTIPSGIWGSIIANMSYYGEIDYGWYRAMNFHMGTPLGPYTPLKDKSALRVVPG